MIPNTLTIAGVDPSGGAGILADVKAMSALGAYATAVIAALTAQNTQGVTGISPVPADFVRQQIDTLFADVRIDGVKIGMLGQEAVTTVVAERMAHFKPRHLVLDPVMIAKSGDHLLEKSAVHALREQLVPQCTMITPNLPEAGVLLDARPVETVKEMRQAAERLRRLMNHSDQRWVFLKGGHLPGSDCIDLLHDGDKMIEMPAKRIDTANTHGTGCTLSAALAALLPQYSNVPDAALAAKKYLYEAIARSGELTVGSGHGPVHHFHKLWPSS
ncbi:bifunctional hydroxymethylpyrimidine kinase/phosphomethylpyrimidine kinase [Alcaligenes nematophilus]|jgi:hydroxymethylpyrimidine/phosphomethylpyrimidine kinase|uniref:hydroxymethylpyrimidine kinase n=4 Tax=Pseudomonadota TaxID=1224 RepID=A0AAE9KQB5_ALCFA|nr:MULTISPECIES: bifunctional hydroxymethylpyrimidine kinase/phosphomethylpyrimidine kinase [Alcaligenes]ERT55113.1 phosphomethylpyrimidine kinase [Alcaligenes sp. EGD-AK7]KGP02238.1 phosphomethylpyrimidine kinase [Alcaligenes faecalis]KVX05004.1 hydroxymethylpyrimidine/phosphomethylpyrimidine kinase [Alcaligenes faecalis]MCB4322821.1 bifunctional hydroxymethylpyrimidine kinase/phosphomethylpyrimidine kinase [Alcaligenes sp. 13f]MCM2558422.1 bifunctional hydroxymethylpyrimidine kinase/phosphom